MKVVSLKDFYLQSVRLFLLLGQSGSVKMSHKDDMPYTNAFIEENLRFVTSTPLGFQHKTNQDAEINGYVIPKDTTV